ncbi:MAG: glucosamine-6-phosphate deaminase [Clostridiaceae bacterium]|nr:glucosamine-6-phosphate deaminase [Clostridiaceae bacterium]
MNIHVFEEQSQIDRVGALLVAAQVLRKPDSVLGFATGSTPLGIYRQMVEMYRGGLVDFSQCYTFNLDEYYGLAPDHEQSYAYYMWKNLFADLELDPEQVNLPDGLAENPEEECWEYEEKIADLDGIDFQILGIGRNGHIGFNEPGSVFEAHTHLVDLTADTRDANARFFDNPEEVPSQALSMGTGSIMRAREIVLIATGSEKADAVAAMVNGPVDPACQASILQCHPVVTILLDQAAAAKL